MTPQALPLAIFAILATSPVSAMQNAERVPVIGGDGPELDACGGIGRIATYEGDLDVFHEPDRYSRKKDALPARTLVWLCEGAEEWQGIVYPTGEFQELGDCRVSSPVAEPRAYDGPCEYGWVEASSLQLVAG